MGIKKILGKRLIDKEIDNIEKDPDEKIPKLINLIEKIAIKSDHKEIIKAFKEVSQNPNNNWNMFANRIFKEVSPKVRKSFISNFFVNSALVGLPIIEEMKNKYDCNIPWAILIDPTSACNLKCTGCWAAEYGTSTSLSYDLIDRVITEGKEFGIYMYIYSGGEPLVRKDDLVKLAEKHNDCMFLSFTNATLIDDAFAKELARVGNFMLAISIEGFEEETNMRRGKGTYAKVIEAMDILRKYGVGFGFSTCYHKYNTDIVGSEEYLDLMIEKGCLFGWYFTYMPIGKSAVVDFLATSEQREFMYHQVHKFRDTKPIFLMDFWNDGEYVDGCIAGGRNYFHINSNGDVEPCAFIHYSNVNIKDVSLLEALKSPLFKMYKENQPFNKNHLRPCPLLDNPDMLKEMVHKSNAHSTQPSDQELVDDLTDKCQEVSRNWAKKADEMMESIKSKN